MSSVTDFGADVFEQVNDLEVESEPPPDAALRPQATIFDPHHASGYELLKVIASEQLRANEYFSR